MRSRLWFESRGCRAWIRQSRRAVCRALCVGGVAVAGLGSQVAAAPTGAAPTGFVAGSPTIGAQDLAPDELPPTRLSYEIAARLDPATREVAGTLRLRWWSPAEQSLAAVPLHLYLNGFSHEGSTWMREGLGRVRFDDRDYTAVLDDPWGWIELEQVLQLVDGSSSPCRVGFRQPDDGNPFDRSLAEIGLATPVEPGGELVLEVTFRSRLPIPIARTGGIDRYFHVGQWFPKLGMYEAPGVRGATVGRWAARQFHGASEFYAEFADYDVTIVAPADFVVVATGQAPAPASTEGDALRHRFVQRSVHDFSFVAGRDLHVETYPHKPLGGGPQVTVHYVTPAGLEAAIAEMRAAAESTLDTFGSRIGPYPYATLTIVAPPWQAKETAGMEYPTLVTSAPADPLLEAIPLRLHSLTVAHEIGHNYFQGLVASDEQREGFLDEGFAEYWGMSAVAAMRTRPGGNGPEGTGLDGNAVLGFTVDDVASTRRSLARVDAKIDQPLLSMPTSLFYPGTVGQQIYIRTRLILMSAARRFGSGAVDDVFRAYFHRWRFRHPGAADFLAVVDEVGSPELAAFLREALAAPRLPDYAVEQVESEPWAPPKGWVPGPTGRQLVTGDDDASGSRYGFDAAADDTGDGILATITDPGRVDPARRVEGWTERIRLARQDPATDVPGNGASTGAAVDDDPTESHYESSVLLRGAGYQNLPVDVRFRFADGAIVVDRWDGRSPWRRYEFLRPARLEEVWIDPQDTLVLDPNADNNTWRRESDDTLANPLAGWLGMIGQWLVVAAGWL